jgi:hypothetical protein
MCLRDVDMQKVVFCCTCPMIEILEMQPPTSFEMKKTITTITAKFVLIVERQKMKREVVWPKTKKQNTKMIDVIVFRLKSILRTSSTKEVDNSRHLDRKKI